MRIRSHTRPLAPEARRDRVLAYDIGDELLLYDQDRQKAHCLGAEAAALWRWCDGRTTIPEMAARLQERLGVAVPGDIVEAALRRLARAGLVRGAAGQPGRGTTRRDHLRHLGLTAGFVVASVAIPAPWQAASCLVFGECFFTDFVPCSGLPCCNGGRCQRAGQSNRCVCQ